MKITFATLGDARDVKTWSGIPYHVAEALTKLGAEVEYVTLDPRKKTLGSLLKLLLYRLAGKRYLVHRNAGVIKSYARTIRKRMSPDADVVLASGSTPVALLECGKPMAFYTGSTFAAMTDYYDTLANLCAESVRDGNRFEKMALDRCAVVFFSCDWAKKSAVKDYGIDPDKIKVVPYGANVPCNRTPQDIARIAKARSQNTCRLLFVGVDWQRKGGPIAVAVTEELRRRGLDARLEVAGIDTLPEAAPGWVVNHGFISKSTPQGRTKLNGLFEECHFFLLPTRAEAYGVVFNEASSFGLPSVTTKTGGVPTAVRDGKNGVTFALDAPVSAYADWIYGMFTERNQYEALALSSFNEYQTRLNWEVAGKALYEGLASAAAKNRG